jgi:hypothetical protein
VVPCREKREGSEERTWWCPGKEKGSHDSDLPRKKVGAASDKGVSAQPFYITWMATRRPPPRSANRWKAPDDTHIDRWAPRVRVPKFNLNLDLKSQHRNNSKEGYKKQQNLWRWNGRFGTILVIETFF